jgi:hypothetical protein
MVQLGIDESESCRELGCLGFIWLTISSRKSPPTLLDIWSDSLD